MARQLGDPLLGRSERVGGAATTPESSLLLLDPRKPRKVTGGEGTRALAVDLDCNVLVSDWTTAGGFAKYSPSGKKIATAALPYVTNDLAVGPKGDVYAKIQSQGIVRLTEDRSKPRGAVVAGRISVAGGVAKVKYTLTGIACPAQIPAVATLSGGVKGKASVKGGSGEDDRDLARSRAPPRARSSRSC